MLRDFSSVAAMSCAPLPVSRDATAIFSPSSSGALPDVTSDFVSDSSLSVAEVMAKFGASASLFMCIAPRSSSWVFVSSALSSESCAGVRP